MDKVVMDATKPNQDLIWMWLINLTNKVAKITVQKAIKEFNPDGGIKLKSGNLKPICNISSTVR